MDHIGRHSEPRRLLSYLSMSKPSSVRVAMQPDDRVRTVTLVGFGEAGVVFANVIAGSGWGGDLLVSFADRAPSRATVRRVERIGLERVDLDEACRRSDLVLSLVTPSSALDVAGAFARRATRALTFVDLNSVGPDAASTMEAAFSPTEASFVKGAILGPVPLQESDVPMVLGGPSAVAVARTLRTIGFGSVAVRGSVVDPAIVKMLWSVVSKGVIALYAEALVAAERLGLAETMLELMRLNLGVFGEDAMVERLLVSSIGSGERRVVEMREARATLTSVGVEAHSVTATIAWLEALAALQGGWSDARPASEAPTSVELTEVVRSLSELLTKRT